MQNYRKTIILTLFLIIYSNAQNLPINSYPTFSQYVKKYKKQYQGTEYNTRENIYNARVKKLQSLVNIAYSPGVNSLSDWNDQQIKSLKGLMTLSSPSGKNLPNPSPNLSGNLNWASQKKVSPIKDQKKCASGWVFAATGYAESKLMIDGRYNQIQLADQKVFQCTSQSSCKGGYLQYAMDSIVQGMPQSTIFTSYKPDFEYPGICYLKVIQIGRNTQNYYKLSDQQLITLLEQRPIAISLSANGWENYGSGIYSCAPTDQVNHAALLVGYNSGSWIVKNSWGSDWGENGFIRISRLPGANCKIGTSAHRTYQFYLFSTLSLFFVLIVSFV